MSPESQTAPTFLVFALRPCDYLDDFIRRAKAKVKTLAGDQTYLSHPPHLTLYLSAFDSPQEVVSRCAELVSRWRPPQFHVSGWHHFGGDVLTGNETLVCAIDPIGAEEMRAYQRELLAELPTLRNAKVSSSRYRPHYRSLTEQRRAATESYGFPFVGPDWIPHFTIASIAPSAWDAVWQLLKSDPPHGNFTCESLSIYRLEDDEPKTWSELPIGTRP